MKKIKLFVMFLLLIVILVFGSELYQNHLDSFTEGLSFFHFASNNKADWYSKVVRLAEDNNCSIFSFDQTNESMLKTVVTVYASKNSQKEVTHQCRIEPGEFKSLFSGITTVEFKELYSNPATEGEFYLIGDEEDIKLMNEAYRRSFGGGPVHKSEVGADQWLYPAILSVFGVLTLLLTWFEILLKKKENFVLISLGKSGFSIAIKNIIIDILFIGGIYTVLFFALRGRIYVGYMLRETISGISLIILVNSFLHLTVVRYDLKKALSSSSFSGSVLSNCYVIKAIVMIITVIILTSNVVLTVQNSHTLFQYKNVDPFEGYEFLDVHFKRGYLSEDIGDIEADDYTGKIEKRLFYEMCRDGKAAFSFFGMESKGRDYLFIDKNASCLINDTIEKNNIIMSADYSVLIPSSLKKQKKNIKEKAESIFDCFFPELTDDAKVETVIYAGEKDVLYFENKNDDLTSCFSTADDPVIIYCHFSNELLVSALKGEMLEADGTETANIMFKLSPDDLSELEKRVALESEGLELSHTGLVEKANYGKSAMERIILLNTVMSLFMIALELMITATTIRLEYAANAMTVALKKVLGYSMTKRNRGVFLLNTFAAFIGVFTTIMISITTRITVWRYAVAISIVLMLFEGLIICFYVKKADDANVSKILKGGSL